MTDQDVIRAGLDRVAQRLAGVGAHVSSLTRLSGGASQEIWAFDVARGERVAAYILRRAPGGLSTTPSAQAIGLPAEANVIQAARAAGAPAPVVACICDSGDGLGTAYVMERLSGETIARKILRDTEYADARALLARQCGEALAQIHAAPPASLPNLPFSDARQQLDRYEEIYRSFDTPRPVFDLAFRRLRDAVPAATDAALVHGDFRLGNLMVGRDGLVAALDWELAHMGDPAEDLGWLCTPSWRFGQIEKPVGGFGTVEALLAGYHAAGGDRRVNAAAVRYWTVFGALKWGVMCLLMFRAYDSGADPSVERAAIGRRASETELDLMLLMTGKM